GVFPSWLVLADRAAAHLADVRGQGVQPGHEHLLVARPQVAAAVAQALRVAVDHREPAQGLAAFGAGQGAVIEAAVDALVQPRRTSGDVAGRVGAALVAGIVDPDPAAAGVVGAGDLFGVPAAVLVVAGLHVIDARRLPSDPAAAGVVAAGRRRGDPTPRGVVVTAGRAGDVAAVGLVVAG